MSLNIEDINYAVVIWDRFSGEINPNTVLMPFALGVPYTIIFACYAVILKTIRKNNRY